MRLNSEYPEFRLKVVLTSIIVISASLALTTLSSNLTMGLMHGIVNKERLVISLIKESLLYGLLPGTIIGVILNKYLKPFHDTTYKIFNKEELDTNERDRAIKIITRLNSVIIIMNIFVYLISFIVNLITSPFVLNSFIVSLLYTLSTAAIFSVIEYNIINMSIYKAKSLLKIYTIESSPRKMPIHRKNVILITSLTVFISLTLIDASKMIYTSEMMYEELLHKVVKGDLTLDQARRDYIEETAQFLQVDKSIITFPYDFTKDTKPSVTPIYIIYFFQLLIVTIIFQYTSSLFQRKQLQNLNSKMKEISMGNGDLTKQVEILDYDEVGELTDTINNFLGGLRSLLKEVKNLGSNVKQSANVIKNVLITTEDSTYNIVAANEQTSKSTKDQIEIANETTNNLKEMLESVEQIAQNIETQASFVEQTSSSINEMAANIESVNQTTRSANDLSNNLVTVANKGGEAVNQSIVAVKRVEEFSDEIIQMVSVITNIADKTNLLAMNAAIEAAHAGESGKGFAVVAQEVRKLAEDSSGSAKQISDHIKKMISLVNNGVELSEGAGKALNIVGVDVKHTSQLIDEVSLAMSEQSAGTNEVLGAITSLMDSTQSIREITKLQQSKNVIMNSSIEGLQNSFKQIEQASLEQSNGTKNIQNSVKELKRVILQNEEATNDLEKLLEGFIL